MAISPELLLGYSPQYSFKPKVETTALKTVYVEVICAHQRQEGAQSSLAEKEIQTEKHCQSCQKMADVAFRGPLNPGKKATFIPTKEDLNKFIATKDLFFRKDFKSTLPSSFLKEFKLLGYKGGDVRIYIQFEQLNAEVFLRFLAKNDFHLTVKSCNGGYYYITKDIKETQRLFEVIKNNNSFDGVDLERLEMIVEGFEIVVAKDTTRLNSKL